MAGLQLIRLDCGGCEWQDDKLNGGVSWCSLKEVARAGGERKEALAGCPVGADK